MAIILFDNAERKRLFPLTGTRAVADLRMGLFIQKERWQRVSGVDVFIYTKDYLQKIYPEIPQETNTWIDASVIADDFLTEKILSLEDDSALADEKGLVAGKFFLHDKNDLLKSASGNFKTVYKVQNIQRLNYCWQMFQWNDAMIRKDFSLITQNRISQKISSTNKIISPENIFAEEGATIEYSFINASTGPVYFGKSCTVMEGCFIRGPFAMCENSVLKMGAKVYGATTFGPNCTGGGEIKNSVLQSNSNKAHDGYLGDSVIGNWCNIGAGTSNSNIKNTAAEVLMKDHETNEMISVGNKCGIIMGDYSRVAINSSINTGTEIGVCCNIFGEGLLPKNIPDFSWGTKNAERYKFNKALRDINNWKKLKQQNLSDTETAVLKHIFEQ